MPKGPSKSAAAIQRLLEERRQYEAWLARITATADSAPERLAETELRHEVGEYDEGQWSQVHKDALADLGAVRDELMDVERDITRLEELDELVLSKPAPAAARAAPPRPPEKPPERRKTPIDELAFLKSVTEDDRTPSPGRASGAQYQPDEVLDGTPLAPIDENAPVEKTLKCKECGTMNVATEWYCEKCGGELAAM